MAVVGTFRLVGRIGTGGRGAVYAVPPGADLPERAPGRTPAAGPVIGPDPSAGPAAAPAAGPASPPDHRRSTRDDDGTAPG